MKIHHVRWCKLNKLEIRFQCVTNTLQYVGIHCHMTKWSQNFVRFYTFELHVSYPYVYVRYLYNSAYVRRSLGISFSKVMNASDTLGLRLYTLIQSNKVAKIRNRYNQVPHLTQDTNGKVTNSQKTPQTRAKRSALSQQV